MSFPVGEAVNFRLAPGEPLLYGKIADDRPRFLLEGRTAAGFVGTFYGEGPPGRHGLPLRLTRHARVPAGTEFQHLAAALPRRRAQPVLPDAVTLRGVNVSPECGTKCHVKGQRVPMVLDAVTLRLSVFGQGPVEGVSAAEVDDIYESVVRGKRGRSGYEYVSEVLAEQFSSGALVHGYVPAHLVERRPRE